MLTFYEDGVLYRQGDTFVVGLTGRPSRSLERRLKHDLADGQKVEIKKVSMSRSDYAYLMRKATALIVATVGTNEFSGVLPDYENEQIKGSYCGLWAGWFHNRIQSCDTGRS